MAGKARYFSSNCSKPSHRLEVSSMAMLIVTLSLIWSASIVHASDKSLQLSGKAVGKTADHSKFEILQQEFKSGPEVTKACLSAIPRQQIRSMIPFTGNGNSKTRIQARLSAKRTSSMPFAAMWLPMSHAVRLVTLAMVGKMCARPRHQSQKPLIVSSAMPTPNSIANFPPRPGIHFMNQPLGMAKSFNAELEQSGPIGHKPATPELRILSLLWRWWRWG